MYKEDFNGFKEVLDEVTKYIIKEKGEEVISDFKPKENFENKEDKKDNKKDSDSFTNIEFEDI